MSETINGDAVDGQEEPRAPRPSKLERLEAEGDIAADYLEELLDIADMDGDIDMDVVRRGGPPRPHRARNRVARAARPEAT